MCSILFTNKEVSSPEKHKLLQLRGPDATNKIKLAGYTFIHNLWSLTGEFTIQPVRKNNTILLFNGEIYNYKDIDSLSPSDSYSILTAYENYGIDFVKHLKGEFALLLVDVNSVPKPQLWLDIKDVSVTSGTPGSDVHTL